MDQSGIRDVACSAKSEVPDRREGERHLAVLRIAVIRTVTCEAFCLVRNISTSGLMADIYSEVEQGDPVVVELRQSRPMAGKVAWVAQGRVGIHLCESIDIDSTLGDRAVEAGRDDNPREPRWPFIEREARGRMRVGALIQAVLLLNLSTCGGTVRLSRPVGSGEKIVLLIEGLPSLHGTIQWRDGEDAGIAFEIAIPFETLARWSPRRPSQLESMHSIEGLAVGKQRVPRPHSVDGKPLIPG